MVVTAGRLGPARSRATPRGTVVGRVTRAVVSAHLVAILGQPVFAGVYLSGDFDGLRWHAIGADVVTTLGYTQLIAAIAVWIRLRHKQLFFVTAGLVTAETVQYFAGMAGALWLHLPLGVLTIAGLVLQFVAVWRGLLPRSARGPLPSADGRRLLASEAARGLPSSGAARDE